MNRLLQSALLAIVAAIAVPVLSFAAQAAPPTARAYAPENLRTLSQSDQVRVISLEYSEQSSGRRIPDDQLRFYLDQVNRSNWGFSRIKQDIAQSLAGGGNGPWPPVGGGGSIRCESDNNRARTCQTPWSGSSRLVRQLSDTACTEGRSWHSQGGQVHVSGGCRGEFAQDRYDQPPVGGGETIRCESDNGRARTCRVPWKHQTRLVRQLSGTPCIEGRSWQSHTGYVYVSGGCRGEFASRRQVSPGYPGSGSNYSVTCSSTGNRRTSCAWNSRYGRPYLQRQLSGTNCRENSNWGYDGNAVWVSNGCRALFAPR